MEFHSRALDTSTRTTLVHLGVLMNVHVPNLTTILCGLGLKEDAATHISGFCDKWYPTAGCILAGAAIMGSGNHHLGDAVKQLILGAPDTTTLSHLGEAMIDNGIPVDDTILQKAIQALIPV